MIAAVALGMVSLSSWQAMTTPPAPIADVWQRLADCESGEWTSNGGHVPGSATWDATAGIHEGGLQFAPSTWDGFKPSGYPTSADQATPAQQVEVAERVLAAQGWGAWPVCSRRIGVRR